MNTWLPLLAGFTGTIIGGVIAYLNAAAQWRRQQRTDRNRYLLSKLEELCNVVLEVQTLFERTWGELLGRINGWPTSEQLPGAGRPIPLKQMQLLTSLYFETLVPHAKAVVAGRDRMGEYVAKSLSQVPTEKAERQKLSTEATTAHESANAACNAFLEEAARLARRLVPESDAV
jgi:hypothetical protein